MNKPQQRWCPDCNQPIRIHHKFKVQQRPVFVVNGTVERHGTTVSPVPAIAVLVVAVTEGGQLVRAKRADLQSDNKVLVWPVHQCEKMMTETETNEGLGNSLHNRQRTIGET